MKLPSKYKIKYCTIQMQPKDNKKFPLSNPISIEPPNRTKPNNQSNKNKKKPTGTLSKIPHDQQQKYEKYEKSDEVFDSESDQKQGQSSSQFYRQSSYSENSSEEKSISISDSYGEFCDQGLGRGAGGRRVSARKKKQKKYFEPVSSKLTGKQKKQSSTSLKYEDYRYQRHELVWAKVTGYPWWPGKIISLGSDREKSNKYNYKNQITAILKKKTSSDSKKFQQKQTKKERMRQKKIQKQQNNQNSISQQNQQQRKVIEYAVYFSQGSISYLSTKKLRPYTLQQPTFITNIQPKYKKSWTESKKLWDKLMLEAATFQMQKQEQSQKKQKYKQAQNQQTNKQSDKEQQNESEDKQQSPFVIIRNLKRKSQKIIDSKTELKEKQQTSRKQQKISESSSKLQQKSQKKDEKKAKTNKLKPVSALQSRRRHSIKQNVSKQKQKQQQQQQQQQQSEQSTPKQTQKQTQKQKQQKISNRVDRSPAYKNEQVVQKQKDAKALFALLNKKQTGQSNNKNINKDMDMNKRKQSIAKQLEQYDQSYTLKRLFERSSQQDQQKYK